MRLTRSLLLAALLGTPAHALLVPYAGWTSSADGKTWLAPNEACVLQESQLTQAFPLFTNVTDAQAFAVKLQNSLSAQGMAHVTAQPIDRAGTWGVLAAYEHKSSGSEYRIMQLYLSNSGKLRTITGSTAALEASDCVGRMNDFVRYLAN
ncbi:hypothetical protein [Deinococcus maricopensis]|uniref:DUF1795 domain-containing protein n=1 Tax=Deinococcus maricopensis (strain DSM 21211 / LMG 22137 / NRRL B-23946 / LB-34) TaxID=709986 RepID=E8UB85_DEIML|nr:hypothetical protein [Deinococcus maricopensis]ADV68324.1 conserved hypothetical protein, precursor [Deinococcus maricopensis DSM 21211]